MLNTDLSNQQIKVRKKWLQARISELEEKLQFYKDEYAKLI